jgi:6-phosphogluconolactonase
MTPRLELLRDPDVLAAAAAAHVADAARAAIAGRGRFAIALAGGSTPRRTYQRLASAITADAWARIHVFFGDERCVPPADSGSNYRMARESLLGSVPVPDANVHRIRGELGPVEAAALYDRELAQFFGAPTPADATRSTFDLVLLGLGHDGHTASLFPDSAAFDDPRWAAPAHAPPGVTPAERVTLTLPALDSAREAVFLVAGAEKRDAVARVLGTDRDSGLPAARVAPRHGIVWFLDRGAGPGLVGAGGSGR